MSIKIITDSTADVADRYIGKILRYKLKKELRIRKLSTLSVI